MGWTVVDDEFDELDDLEPPTPQTPTSSALGQLHCTDYTRPGSSSEGSLLPASERGDCVNRTLPVHVHACYSQPT